MGGESGPTGCAILFVKTKKYLKTREIKSAHMRQGITYFINHPDLQNT
jgi:hypothetical protein